MIKEDECGGCGGKLTVVQLEEVSEVQCTKCGGIKDSEKVIESEAQTDEVEGEVDEV